MKRHEMIRKFASDIAFSFMFGIKAFIRPGRAHALPIQLRGAILGIGISIVPLLVVIVISNGMIDGITKRLIEVSTYHVQVSFSGNLPDRLLEETRKEISSVEGVRFAFVERDGFVQLRFNNNISGTALRCTPNDLFTNDEGFRKYFKIIDGDDANPELPGQIAINVFDDTILREPESATAHLFLSAYEKDNGKHMYFLRKGVDQNTISSLMHAYKTFGISTILLGKALADKLKAGPGDMLYLLSFYEFHSRIVAKSAKAIVSCIFSTGYQYIDKLLAYVPYDMGITIIPKNRSKEYIGVKVDDPFRGIEGIIASINKIVQNKSFYADVQSWYELQINQYRSFQLTKTLLVFIMILIVIVAAANVYSSIVMIVMDRTMEIAILKSMGARPRTITLSFLFTGFYTGAFGAFLGLLFGLTIAVNINEVFKIVEFCVNNLINIIKAIISPFITMEKSEAFVILNPQFYLEKIPIKISVFELIFVTSITIFLSIVFAFIPAQNAGRIRPIEIIRKY